MSNKGQIIQIANEAITIGMDSGALTNVRPTDLNFPAVIGDRVEIFSNEAGLIVTKSQPVAPANPFPEAAATTPGAININLAQNVDQSNAGYDPQGGGKVVDKTGYVLLAFLLGGFGAHKFYAGKTGAGVVYLLFCWTGIPLFISLVEGVIGLTKTSDVNGNILI